MTSVEMGASRSRTKTPGRRVLRIVPTKAEIDPVGFARRLKTRKAILGLIFPIGLLLLWELAYRLDWIDPASSPARARSPRPRSTCSRAASGSPTSASRCGPS